MRLGQGFGIGGLGSGLGLSTRHLQDSRTKSKLPKVTLVKQPMTVTFKVAAWRCRRVPRLFACPFWFLSALDAVSQKANYVGAGL